MFSPRRDSFLKLSDQAGEIYFRTVFWKDFLCFTLQIARGFHRPAPRLRNRECGHPVIRHEQGLAWPQILDKGRGLKEFTGVDCFHKV
jgi:hypothetical protein